MRIPCWLLFAPILAAQVPDPAQALALDLRTGLGGDSLALIQVAPPGCWEGLLLGTSLRPEQPVQQRTGEASVEVWDLALRESSRNTAFSLYLGTLRQRLSKALQLPPPKHQALELSDIMQSDPSNPQKLDLTKVKSLQDRFNVLPPNGSPVKQP